MSILETFLDLEKRQSKIPYLYAIVSNMSLVFMQICLKQVAPIVGPAYALAVRAFFLMAINYAVMAYYRIPLSVNNPQAWRIILKRMFWSTVSVSFFLIPLAYVSAGIVTSLFNTNPIIIIFLEAFYYKKPIHREHLILTLVSFVGVLLVIRPDFLFGTQNSSHFEKMLYLCVLIGAFGHSCSMLLLRQLKDKMSNVTALHYFYISQVLFNSFLISFREMDIQHNKLTAQFYFTFVGLVLFAYCTQFLMTRSIFLKEPSYILPFGYITVVFSSISDFLFFGQHFPFLSIIGILITSVGLLSKILIKEEPKN